MAGSNGWLAEEEEQKKKGERKRKRGRKKEKRKKRRVRYLQKGRGTLLEQRTSTEGPEIEREARLDLLTRDFLLVQV